MSPTQIAHLQNVLFEIANIIKAQPCCLRCPSGNSLCTCFLNMCSASPQQPTMFGRFALGWPKFGWFALGWPGGKKAGGKRAHIGEAVVGQTVHLLWTPCPSAPTLTKTFLALFLPHPSTVFLFFRTVLSTKIHIQQKRFALHLFRPCFVICTC